MVPWPSPQVCLTFRPLTEHWKLSWGNMKHFRLDEILSENSKAFFISTNSGEYKKHGAFSFTTQERKSFKMPSMIGQHNEPLLADIRKFIRPDAGCYHDKINTAERDRGCIHFETYSCL